MSGTKSATLLIEYQSQLLQYHSWELHFDKQSWPTNTPSILSFKFDHENKTNQATLYKSFNILLWTKKKESNQFFHLFLLGGIQIDSLSNLTAVTQAATQAETQAAALQTRNFDTPLDHTSLVMINHNNILEELRSPHCSEHQDITTSSTIYQPWRRSNLLQMLRPIPTSLRRTSSERLQDWIWSFLKHWTKKRTMIHRRTRLQSSQDIQLLPGHISYTPFAK